MNPSDIEALWRSPHNQPSPEDIDLAHSRLVVTLRRRQRGFVIQMACAFVWLVLITGGLAYVVLWPDGAKAAPSFSREWAVLLLLALPWLAALSFVRQNRRGLTLRSDPEVSISASLRAMIAQSHQSLRRMRSILWLHLISVPVLALCISQIHDAGKARPHELISMITVLAVIIALSVTGIFIGMARRRGEVRRLESLLQNYDL